MQSKYNGINTAITIPLPIGPVFFTKDDWAAAMGGVRTAHKYEWKDGFEMSPPGIKIQLRNGRNFLRKEETIAPLTGAASRLRYPGSFPRWPGQYIGKIQFESRCRSIPGRLFPRQIR